MADLGFDLRAKLGPDAADDLVAAIDETRGELMLAVQEHFEARLLAVSADLRADLSHLRSDLRCEIVDGLSRIRAEMANMRTDVLRWSFLFWIGQVAAIASLLAFMLRASGR